MEVGEEGFEETNGLILKVYLLLLCIRTEGWIDGNGWIHGVSSIDDHGTDWMDRMGYHVRIFFLYMVLSFI